MLFNNKLIVFGRWTSQNWTNNSVS